MSEDKKKTIGVEEFDRIFDEGKEDITPYLDLSRIERPGIQRVNVDFPKWMVKELDRESGRLGITRQSLIKYWIGERLDEARKVNGDFGKLFRVAEDGSTEEVVK